MGWYIGVDGPLTFKNAAKLPEIIKEIPLEYILAETDCPYMAPTPFRGQTNEPKYINFVAKKIAEVLEIDVKEVENITNENTRRLFKRLK